MRPASRGSTGFFTTREMLRLSSAIFLLGIVGLLGCEPVERLRLVTTVMGQSTVSCRAERSGDPGPIRQQDKCRNGSRISAAPFPG